jgi:hypothetical protein
MLYDFNIIQELLSKILLRLFKCKIYDNNRLVNRNSTTCEQNKTFIL